MIVSLDLETYSELDLTKCGARRYSEHPSTEVLCLAYSVQGAAPRLWTPLMPLPDVLFAASELWAWNASFECTILENVLKLNIPRSRWRCSMSLALSFGFPGSLNGAASALQVGSKNPDGQRAMRRVSQPRKPTLNDSSVRFTPEKHPDLFATLYRYCIDDVVLESTVHSKLPAKNFTSFELSLYQIDLDANALGMSVDLESVKKIKNEIVVYGTAKAAHAAALTGGIGMRQAAALAAWLGLPNVQARTIEEALATEPLGPAREVLEIRSSLSQSSLAKYDAILASVCDDGRIKGLIQYMGAGRTGRWAGRLVQLQNLPRGILGKSGPWWIEHCLDADTLSLLGDPLKFYSSYIRSCLIASKGMTLIAADYSSIEARIVVWTAGQESSLQQYRDDVDCYCLMASDVFGRLIGKSDTFERFIGKKLVLGAGYGLGPGRFLESCAEDGVPVTPELAERAIGIYRASNAAVVSYWWALDKAVRKALASPGTIVPCRVVSFRAGTDWLQMRLPSGRLLSYYRPSISPDNDVTYFGVNQRTRDWGPQKLYGGKILQHIGEGVARDLMANAIVGLQDTSYRYLVSIHDEVIAEFHTTDQGASLDDFTARITASPAWAKGLPVKAEGFTGQRYRKG